MTRQKPFPLISQAAIALVMAGTAGYAEAVAVSKPPRVTGLRCEYQVDPLGIDATTPRFFWRLESEARGVAQTAYEIQVVADPSSFAATKAVWATGKVASDRVDARGLRRAAPSSRASGTTGACACGTKPGARAPGARRPHSRWGFSRPVTGRPGGSSPLRTRIKTKPEPRRPPPRIVRREGRRAFGASLRHEPRSLRARAERQARGRRLRMTPGWTSYGKRLQYQTYDVTPLLVRGKNVAGAMLGDGWYRGFLAWQDRRNVYGDRLALLCQIRIDYDDGRVEDVGNRRHVEGLDGPHPPFGHLHGRGLRRSAREARMEHGCLRRQRTWGPCASPPETRRSSWRPPARPCAASRSCAP